MLIGDMNVPKMAPADPVFQRLLEFGMRPTKFSTHMGTNLSGVNHFDQITFLPTETATNVLAEEGVFDYDKAVFADLWAMTQGPNPTRTLAEFRRYCRYHISDHRLLWCAFDTTHGALATVYSPDQNRSSVSRQCPRHGAAAMTMGPELAQIPRRLMACEGACDRQHDGPALRLAS